MGQTKIESIHIVTARMLGRKESVSFDLQAYNSSNLQGTPDGESQEQTGRSTVEKATSDLHIKRSTDGAANTNELNVTRLQAAMGSIRQSADRSRMPTLRMRVIGSILWWRLG